MTADVWEDGVIACAALTSTGARTTKTRLAPKPARDISTASPRLALVTITVPQRQNPRYRKLNERSLMPEPTWRIPGVDIALILNEVTR